MPGCLVGSGRGNQRIWRWQLRSMPVRRACQWSVTVRAVTPGLRQSPWTASRQEAGHKWFGCVGPQQRLRWKGPQPFNPSVSLRFAPEPVEPFESPQGSTLRSAGRRTRTGRRIRLGRFAPLLRAFQDDGSCDQPSAAFISKSSDFLMADALRCSTNPKTTPPSVTANK